MSYRDIVEKKEQRAKRVVSMLQSWSERFDQHVTQRRSHGRKGCCVESMVLIPELRRTAGELGDQSLIQIWIRNISASGAGFVTEHKLPTEKKELILSLGTKYFLCRIIRSRQVHDGYWEYGVQLIRETEI